jgi:formylglycine-generating enzyme required for sulfatase activity
MQTRILKNTKDRPNNSGDLQPPTNIRVIPLLFAIMLLTTPTACTKRSNWFLGDFELDVDATVKQISQNITKTHLTKDERQAYLSIGSLIGMASNKPTRFIHTEKEIISDTNVQTYRVIKESASEIETLSSDGEISCWIKTTTGIAQKDNSGEPLFHLRKLPPGTAINSITNHKGRTSVPADINNDKIYQILSRTNKNDPFRNTLDMLFVPAGTTGLLFSKFETRVKDFQAFVEESGHDAVSKNVYGDSASTLEAGAETKQAGGSWRDPHFPEMQNGDHPVVCVSYLDAEAFCAWLTKKERASGKIPEGAIYRLPSDMEWTRACGHYEYPWGDTYPPKPGDGNYLGSEVILGASSARSNELSQSGFQDGVVRTSVVGAFNENRFGIHDMGGNVMEWCSTWYHANLNDEDAKTALPILKNDGGGQSLRVLRGGSWGTFVREALRSSFRVCLVPETRDCRLGFRCVLVVAGQL